MPAILQFVDSIASSPTVREDLNDGTGWSFAAFDLTPPQLRRTTASSMLRDGDLTTASAYENRVLTVTLRPGPYGTAMSSDDAFAGNMQTLARELDRPFNFLRYQPTGATAPVFFRTHRCSPEVLDVQRALALREVTVQIPADPFAYGLAETGSGTISGDPASTAYVDVTPKGDVPTPIRLRIQDNTSGLKQVFAVRADARGVVPSGVWCLQAEAMTIGSGGSGAYGTVTADATASGGSTVAADAMLFGDPWSTTPISVLKVTSPPASAAANRGTYRAFARVKKTVGTEKYTIRLLQGYSTNTIQTTYDRAFTENTTGWRYLDLGLVQLPYGPDPAAVSTIGVPAGAAFPSGFELGLRLDFPVSPTGATGKVRFDCLVLVPADQELVSPSWPTVDSGVEPTLDGLADVAYLWKSADDSVVTTGTLATEGVIPMLRPGFTNRIYGLRNVETTDHTLGSNMAVAWAYWPRYLHLRPAST